MKDKQCPKCGLYNPENAMLCDCGYNFHEQNDVTTKVPHDAPYTILPNGKKRYIRATAIDIIFSILLPFWGLVIGLFAAFRGESERAKTMIIIGAVLLSVSVLVSF